MLNIAQHNILKITQHNKLIVALMIAKYSSDILDKLLDDGRSLVAGRLAGAFRNVYRDSIADDIIKAMKSAGYDIR